MFTKEDGVYVSTFLKWDDVLTGDPGVGLDEVRNMHAVLWECLRMRPCRNFHSHGVDLTIDLVLDTLQACGYRAVGVQHWNNHWYCLHAVSMHAPCMQACVHELPEEVWFWHDVGVPWGGDFQLDTHFYNGQP